MDVPAPLLRIAASQLGAFSRRQAHSAGATDAHLRTWLRRGVVVRAGTNCFRTPMAPRNVRADLWAVVLDVGEPCWVSHHTAAALHGLDGFTLRMPFHLVTSRERHVHRPGHVIHSSGDLPTIDTCEVDRLPVLRAARTLIDLAAAADVTETRLVDATDSALRDGLISDQHLHRRIVALRSSGRAGLGRLVRILDGDHIRSGGHSWLEREFLELLHVAGLPRPATQQVVARCGDRPVRVDFRFPGTPIVIETLGYHFHRTSAQLRRDVERLNALVLDGFAPLQFTYRMIVDDPSGVIASVGSALEGAARAA